MSNLLCRIDEVPRLASMAPIVPVFGGKMRAILNWVGRLHAFGLSVFALTSCLVLYAQGNPEVMQQKLNQVKLTTTTADRTDIVTAGDVIALHRPGLVMFSVDSPLPPTNVYKGGRIGQGFGTALMMSDKSQQQRRFVPGEKCWVTRIEIQNDGVAVDLYSDPYNDIRYYGILKFPFPDKKTFPPSIVFCKRFLRY